MHMQMSHDFLDALLQKNQKIKKLLSLMGKMMLSSLPKSTHSFPLTHLNQNNLLLWNRFLL